MHKERSHTQELPVSSTLAGVGLRLSDWFERWFPDAFALALAAVAVVFVAALASGSSFAQTAQWFGAGFWDLVAFTMQMSMIVVTGYAVATSPPVYAVIRRLAAFPTNGRNAAAYVGLFSMLASLVSWSFSLIFSGLLAREVAHRVRGADYRAIGAAAYLGVGSVWALGLSSSAALIMASPASLPDAIERISGVIPLSQTLGLWQSMLIAAALIVVSMAICYYSAPGDAEAHGMKEMGVEYQPATQKIGTRQTPGEWLEYSPFLTDRVRPRVHVSDPGGRGQRSVDHPGAESLRLSIPDRRPPAALASAILRAGDSRCGDTGRRGADPVPALRRNRADDDRVRHRHAAGAFLRGRVEPAHLPVMIGIYSAFLGLFIPSAGGKWLIEAPYMLEAAKTLKVHLGWVVQTYNATEALANLIHPFWMLPLVGILGLKARDIVGYSMLQFVVHVPLVLFLVWALNYTLQYVPPALP